LENVLGKFRKFGPSNVTNVCVCVCGFD